jgi:hydrogenase nickel incorporation protein HypB
MEQVKLIEIKEEVLSDNRELAADIRQRLAANKVFMLNLMSSPGAGKTSLILKMIGGLKDLFHIGVIEGDIASSIDAEKVIREGVPAVQLRTGGFCHLDASMIEQALSELDIEKLDFIIIENVGNLVCPAEFDTGAAKRAMILSVPEGDDKPLKYPLMFSVCDVLIINKIDYLPGSDFDMKAMKARVYQLNPAIRIFEVSCRTGEGIPEWLGWLESQIQSFSRRI